MSNGNFSTLSVGNNINFFNADGSYMLRGAGTVGTINAAQINSNKYVISSGVKLGILEGGVGYLQGLNISQPVIYTNVPGTDGNLTFTGNYLKQGIVFADNSFLNSANNFNNITTSNINSNQGTFNSLNIIGNLNNSTNTFLTKLTCNGPANFRDINTENITANTAVFSSLTINGNNSFTMPSANILNISGNTISYSNAILPNITTNNLKIKNAIIESTANISSITGNTINVTNSTFANTTSNTINTTTLKFDNGSTLTSAPGTVINAVVSAIWNIGKTNNSPLLLSAGTWLINFNIFLTDQNNNLTGTNYIKSTANNSYFPIRTVETISTNSDGSLNVTAVCSGTFVYKTTTITTIDLTSKINSYVDPSKSYHNAIQIA